MNQTPLPRLNVGKFVEVLSTMYYNPQPREINTTFNLTTLKEGKNIITVYARSVHEFCHWL